MRVGLTFVDPFTGAHTDYAYGEGEEEAREKEEEAGEDEVAEAKEEGKNEGGEEGEKDDVALSSLRRRERECEETAAAATTARDAHAARRDAAVARAEQHATAVATIAGKLVVAEEGLRDPKAELDRVLEKVSNLSKLQLDEMKNLRNPSPSIKAVVAAVHLILNADKYHTRNAAGKAKNNWDEIRTTLVANDFVHRVTSFLAEYKFAAGCAHVADLISEELIDADAPQKTPRQAEAACASPFGRARPRETTGR